MRQFLDMIEEENSQEIFNNTQFEFTFWKGFLATSFLKVSCVI